MGISTTFSGIGDGIVAGKGLNEGTCTTIDKDDKDEEDGSIAVPIDIPFLFSSASELGEGDGTCACDRAKKATSATLILYLLHL